MRTAGKPDPRVVKSRETILSAARTLLQESGPAAVTHQRVAARAGVGRATVYRHWRTPELLLSAAMEQVGLPFFDHFDGHLHRWLRRELRHLADELALPVVARIAVTLVQGAQYDAATRRQLGQQLELIANRLERAIAVAVETGQVDAAVEPRELAACLIGPLVYTTLMQGERVSDALIDRILQAHLPLPR